MVVSKFVTIVSRAVNKALLMTTSVVMKNSSQLISFKNESYVRNRRESEQSKRGIVDDPFELNFSY